ncbi:transcriptional regulator with XRE-family HTH domain [Streptomyces olivoverticillatus]|uniref:Transcriptional regulator with XRE-family HTH domain n=1 Tax=Streptomyces olivoverticillatus TaxID=66427 RepID=A0A7W7LQ66_9ACTN|nr:helix-turn-helix transcriptional regulator [Streptomyces olivoverticillatus]MBB4894252.1 transcriptional regulator with XRE-family HTH domain [Streptomyces olivoverticillatus]
MSGDKQAQTRSATMRMFGSQLMGWRRRAGVSREQLAQEAGYSVDMVKSVKQGRRKPPLQLIDAAELLCKAGGLLRDAAEHIVQSKFPDWFEEYARYEAECASLGLYENQLIPGLFQTEEYARAVFRCNRPPLDDEEIEAGVEARLERQQLLCRTPAAVISLVLEQVTLERWIGGREVMLGQLRHLLKLAELRNIDLQIMPTRRETHAGLAGSMRCLETRDHELLVYSGMQKGSVLLSGPKEVSDLNMRYAILRSQALTPEDSTRLLEKTLGEL